MFNSDHPAFKMSNLSLHRTEAISLAHYSRLVLLLVKRSCFYLQEFASFFVLNFACNTDQTQCFTESLFQLRYYVPRGEKYEVLIMCMLWLIFGTGMVGDTYKTAVAGVRVCVCLWRVCGRRGEREKEVRGKARVGSSSTWFTTDGYCLEFQGHDLMLCSLSLSS